MEGRLKNRLKLKQIGRRVQFYESIQYSQNELDQLSIAEYIQTLNPAQKKQFQKQNPDLSELLFMNQEQKAAYFEGKNQEYFKKLQHQHHRHSKTKKIVKFSDKFQIKYFNSEGSTEQITAQNVEEENYHYGIHFSH